MSSIVFVVGVFAFALTLYFTLRRGDSDEAKVKAADPDPDFQLAACNFGNGSKKIKHLELDLEGCDAACNDDQRCTHFAWLQTDDPENGKCKLNTGPVRLSDVPDAPGPGLICDVITIDWSPEAWAFGCTFLDDEPLLELRTTNHVACGLFCDENDDCTHFAFKPKTNVCRLMSGYVDLDDAARVMFKEGVCGMSPKDEVLWRDGNKALFCLFEGPYYGRPFKANSTECETQCRLSSRCDHFTLNQNVCRLISNAIFEPYQKFTNSKKTLCGHVH